MINDLSIFTNEPHFFDHAVVRARRSLKFAILVARMVTSSANICGGSLVCPNVSATLASATDSGEMKSVKRVAASTEP